MVDVVVVGAGLAGLSAARRLHGAGLSTVVCEAGSVVGGRVRTDFVDGFLLDHGFQVLLPAYPEVRRQVDLAALDARPFSRGLIRMTGDGPRWLAGPWHGRAALRGVAGFASAHPFDGLAVAAMSARDVAVPDRLAVAANPRGTEAELRYRRISPSTIGEVFRPFLAGVFLEPALDTSARLFHLLWRSFLRGGAVLPAGGMRTVPEQLAAGLPEVRTGVEVVEVDHGGVRTGAGERIEARAVVVAADATAAARLLPGLPVPDWHAVTTFYFRTARSPLRSPTLVVDGLGDLLINTVVLSDVAASYAPAGQALVAASVPGRADPSLAYRVRDRLARLYETTTGDWELLAAYPIAEALPAFPAGSPLRRRVRLGPGRYVCGDHRDTPSVQGALYSGRRAAEAVLADLRSGVVG